MSKKNKIQKTVWSRRNVLKAGALAAVGVTVAPTFFIKNAWAEKSIGNFSSEREIRSLRL
ncbi:twin-arginine translocation signal domain-containing protein [Pseudodesulfovibrio sp.]|nr:twin-arginine translocation signal domain-containing protein [Pseudodesulfovibrio sp.]